jgi:predicted transcriptional regulator
MRYTFLTILSGQKFCTRLFLKAFLLWRLRVGVLMKSSKVHARQVVTCLSLLVCLSLIPAYNTAARGAAWQANTTDLSPRDSIKALIEVVPGIHFRGIMETVNRTNGVVQYHLRQMEHSREVFAVNYGHLKGYFSSSMRKLTKKELLALIAVRHPIRNVIIETLLESPQTLNEVAAICGAEANKVLFHVQKLSEAGIINSLEGSKFGIAGDIVNVLHRFAFATALPTIHS